MLIHQCRLGSNLYRNVGSLHKLRSSLLSTFRLLTDIFAFVKSVFFTSRCFHYSQTFFFGFRGSPPNDDFSITKVTLIFAVNYCHSIHNVFLTKLSRAMARQHLTSRIWITPLGRNCVGVGGLEPPKSKDGRFTVCSRCRWRTLPSYTPELDFASEVKGN